MPSLSRFLVVTVLALAVGAMPSSPATVAGQARPVSPALEKLIPKVDGWGLSEAAADYRPENLFEYIDGAAESYLGYDFRELVVAQFKKAGSEAALTFEAYDMGAAVNAFGIFSAERYPENKPAGIGDAGYLEGESLNFCAGRYYVKLLAFGLGDATAATLETFARQAADAVPDKPGLPPLLRLFPKENLVAQSEKFVRKNFMGYDFLHDGYLATYKIDGQEIECFFIAGASEKDAEGMLGRLLDVLAKEKQMPEKIAAGYHVKTRYSQHLFVGRVRGVLCGVVRVPDGLEAVGEKYLKDLSDALAASGAAGN